MGADAAPLRFKGALVMALRRALRMVWQASPRLAIGNLAVVIIQAALPLLSLYLTKLIVDAVAGAVRNPTPDAGRHLVYLIVLAGAAGLANALVWELAIWVGDAQQWMVSDHVHTLLHKKSTEVDLEFYENGQYQDTLHRAQGEASHRPGQVLADLLRCVRGGVSFLAMVGLLAAFHWTFPILLLAAALPAIAVRLKYDRARYRVGFDWTPLERKAWYFERLLVEGTYAKEIRLFQLGRFFLRRHRELRNQLRQERFALATKRSAAMLAAELIGVFSSYGSLAFVAYRAVSGGVTVGGFVMFYQAFQRGQECLHDLLNGIGNLHEHGLFLSSFYEFLDLPCRISEPAQPKVFVRPLHGINFDHVSFKYRNSGRMILNDISLTIPAGQTVALVGENGAGKSTLVKLLCRLYDPTRGVISIDGTDLCDFDTGSLRQNIAVVFQDYVRYCATVHDNIWFGNVNLHREDERVRQAARPAGAEEFIQSLDHGYETNLGTMFDSGVDPSVGEWQKVAIARAFLRDATILILDEPTSALDAYAEQEVLQRFRQAARGRTTILISHRFSTVQFADCIYVLESGSIIEQGSHEQLMRINGTYARMFETQAQYYR